MVAGAIVLAKPDNSLRAIAVIIVRHPVAGAQALVLRVGIWLIAAAVVRPVIAFDSEGSRLGRIIVAGVEAVFGTS